MKSIDLRSDTVTLPTDSMLRAMTTAELGDDVFGEDPTVKRLEEKASEITGMEASLFVVSGTMANLVSLLSFCGRGDEVILGDRSHIFRYEQGGCSALGGIHPHTIANLPDGTLSLTEVEKAVRGDNVHYPRTKLLAVENTHNLCNGAPLEPGYMSRLGALCRRHGIKLHVDGARIFNASVSLGVPVRDLVRDADSVAFCISKGTGAPCGAVLCGTADFINEARRNRKLLGGGLRQAGVLAAAGLVALDEMIERLAEDHANARKLAEGLARIPGIIVDPALVRTNIVFIELDSGCLPDEDIVESLAADGLLLLRMDHRKLRAVTHYRVDSGDMDRALSIFQRVFTAGTTPGKNRRR